MRAIYDAIVRAMERAEYDHEVAKEGEAVRLALRCNISEFAVLLVVHDDLLVAHAFNSMCVPEPRVPAVLEFLGRANYGRTLGCFDFDFDDRDVSFRAASLCREDPVSEEIVLDLLGLVLSTFDRYYPGLGAVAFGDADPAQAVARIEQSHEES